jgi:hemin uptake protein HemP
MNETLLVKRAYGRSVEPPRKKRRFASFDLFEGDDELIIEHAGQEYRLRRTRQDKLILTK